MKKVIMTPPGKPDKIVTLTAAEVSAARAAEADASPGNRRFEAEAQAVENATTLDELKLAVAAALRSI